jgi:hypothetical protein
MSKQGNSTPNSSIETAKLVDLHIAEYQALTTRCSYWITMQYAALTVILVFLSVAATLWSSPIDRRLFFWGGSLFLQVIGYFWMQTQGEQYTAIVYIERVLRPAVRDVVQGSQFWCYEPFLASIRSPRPLDPLVSPEFWELPIALLATIIVLGIFIHGVVVSGSRLLIGISGWSGFILNLLFLVFQWLKTIEVRKIRVTFSKTALTSGCDFAGINFP